MSPETERSRTPRRPAPLQRRLLLFAAAVLAPLFVGALACGLVLLLSSTRSHRLAEETVRESKVSVALFQNLEASRIAGSSYMEDGEREDLVAFQAAAKRVVRALGQSAFDEAEERALLRRLDRDWQAAVRQLRDTRPALARRRTMQRIRRMSSRSI